MNKRIKKKHMTSMLKSMQHVRLEEGDKIVVQLVQDVTLEYMQRLRDGLSQMFSCPIIILPNTIRATIIKDFENNIKKTIDKA